MSSGYGSLISLSSLSDSGRLSRIMELQSNAINGANVRTQIQHALSNSGSSNVNSTNTAVIQSMDSLKATQAAATASSSEGSNLESTTSTRVADPRHMAADVDVNLEEDSSGESALLSYGHSRALVQQQASALAGASTSSPLWLLGSKLDVTT